MSSSLGPRYRGSTASKAGLLMMAKTLAQEAGPHGFRVLCIASGAIRTPINEAVWEKKADYQELLAKIPLGRIGEPCDVAWTLVMLACYVASYATGTTVFIDAGMTDFPQFAYGG